MSKDSRFLKNFEFEFEFGHFPFSRLTVIVVRVNRVLKLLLIGLFLEKEFEIDSVAPRHCHHRQHPNGRYYHHPPRCTVGQKQVILRHRITHFTMSSGVSELASE